MTELRLCTWLGCRCLAEYLDVHHPWGLPGTVDLCESHAKELLKLLAKNAPGAWARARGGIKNDRT